MAGSPSAEDTYLRLYDRFALYRDQLGDTLEEERRSDFAQHAEYALLFLFGGIAAGIMSRIGEALADGTLRQLTSLLTTLRAKRSAGSVDTVHEACIDALPSIVTALSELDLNDRNELQQECVRGLIELGYSPKIAEVLVDVTLRDMSPPPD